MYIEFEFVEFTVVAFSHHHITVRRACLLYSSTANEKRRVYLTSVVTSYHHRDLKIAL
ncbi:MAG: hypothetical protein ACREOZ_02935 [Gloeomargaritales cyanobacterium]